MFLDVGSLYESGDMDLPVDSRELCVTSCGHYKLVKMAHMYTNRPEGRRDFQLLYIRGGNAKFRIHGEDIVLSAGHFVFYFPGETQYYEYDLCDAPDIYWVHFSGFGCDVALTELGFFSQRVFFAGGGEFDYARLYERIIRELQLKRHGFEMICSAYLMEILCAGARGSSERGGDGADPRHPAIEAAIRRIHAKFADGFVVAEFAAEHGMSTCWFTRLFRAQTGVSPQRYLTDLRMNLARELLTSSDRIGEIGGVVGYHDPLYFSRVFKRENGVSPSDYRRTKGHAVFP